ncbi:hypothetical protein C8J47_3823 [Sphingomonas sp. PP-F2F-G114-C0414]|uniref:class I SAM-dependent methyltransferase n=1 Tax=Sphingomonas sp. PP-F2F-G114-C0414 TaxID=2135662 RepID=UPI000F0F544D|nr:class I SAM-dependent methyltransferase [Sphingomonas sp. PP-F2F-G114-C0414]RMB24916.1 hypothetical protein C8J47_3823 [Sphingomonas sp. PP-F2F-G114-C0414]
MSDRAIGVISGAADSDINFSWFRHEFMVDNGLKDTLKSGHVVIDTADKLDQYLYTYGLMIESQWKKVGPLLGDVKQPTVLIDYGCGQGLAGLLLKDLTQGRLFGAVRDILLIEPSAVALARAEALYRRIAPNATVTIVCKRFDALSESDVPDSHAGETLHVFSNSLDVLGFDPLKLLAKTMRPGAHTIISTSHDRTFNGGTPQIERVRAAFDNQSMPFDLTIQQSTLKNFTCDNPSQSKGVVWLCQLEIEDG